MSQPTRTEVLEKLRRRYQSAGLEPKGNLLDQAQALLGYHRKPAKLLPFLRPIWQAADYARGRRLVAMLDTPRGTLLRQQCPIRGSVWDDGNPGWLGKMHSDKNNES